MTAAPPAPELSELPAKQKAFERIFSFPAVIASLLIVLAVLSMRSRFDDPDMWWHLKTGQVIWTTRAIPTTDIYSYTTNHHAYVPHEWLAQLCIFISYKLGGYSGLMLWLCLFTSVILIAGYALCSLYSGNTRVAFLGAFAIWLFGTSGFAIRPQVVGYSLLIIELILLHLGQTHNRRWFFALPALFALWVNCHGSFFLGIVVASIILFSSYFSFKIGPIEAPHWEPGQRSALAAALLLSVFALFLNPTGTKAIEYPLNMLFTQSTATHTISEWLPLQLESIRGLALLLVVGTLFLGVIVRRGHIFWHELLLVTLAVWLAASHRRLIFPFGILVAPILCRVVANTWDRDDAARCRPLLNAVLIVTSLLVAFLAFPNQLNLARQVVEHSPVKAVEFVKAQHLAGPMLNDFVDGGYLIWAAPEYPVFIDGRADIFDWSGVMAEFGKWTTLQVPATDLLDKYNIHFCLLPRASPVATVIPLLPGWKAVYSDEAEIVIVRADAGTASEPSAHPLLSSAPRVLPSYQTAGRHAQ